MKKDFVDHTRGWSTERLTLALNRYMRYIATGGTPKDNSDMYADAKALHEILLQDADVWPIHFTPRAISYQLALSELTKDWSDVRANLAIHIFLRWLLQTKNPTRHDFVALLDTNPDAYLLLQTWLLHQPKGKD